MLLSDIWGIYVPNWLSSIGTISAVFLALFQRRISLWFNRPIIRAYYHHKHPYYDEDETCSSSSNSDRKLKIRIRIENSGKTTADHCVVSVDRFYEKRRDSTQYFCRPNTPMYLRDHRNASLSYISPNNDYYLDIAAIQKCDEIGSSSEKGKTSQFYKLFLLTDKGAVKLGKGTYLIPIKICSPKMVAVRYYLKVFWDCDNYSTDKKDFFVELLDENSFKKITIEE